MPHRSWDDQWRRYPESRPLAADGIATSKQRGAMASTWWSRRFVDVLTSYGLGARMQRGRRYARSGQVLSLEVSHGLVTAQVQGSRRTPYLVSVRAPVANEAAWDRLDATLRAKVGFVARLLAGEVPPELEQACDEAGITLFPDRWSALTTACNCPDWENPCKHLAAVLYVFADQLDADPWLLFTWRGRTRDQMLAHLDQIALPGKRADGLPSWWPLMPGTIRPEHVRWQAPAPTTPEPAHGVLRRLEPLDVDVLHRSLADVLTTAYPLLVTPEE